MQIWNRKALLWNQELNSCPGNSALILEGRDMASSFKSRQNWDGWGMMVGMTYWCIDLFAKCTNTWSDIPIPAWFVSSFCSCFITPFPHCRDGYFVLSWPAKGQDKSHHDWADFASSLCSALPQRSVAPGAVDIKSEHILLTVAECMGGWSRLVTVIFKNKLTGALPFIKKGDCISCIWFKHIAGDLLWQHPGTTFSRAWRMRLFAFTGIEQEGRQIPWHFAPWKPKPGPERIVLSVQRPGIRSEIHALKRPDILNIWCWSETSLLA